MSDPQTILLRSNRLFIGYGKSFLFEDLNLSLNAGELICFMGPNGIGKSTLLRTLSGLQKPLSGEVTLDVSKEVHHQLSVVLTDRVTSVNLTVSELISFGRYPYLNWNIQMKEQDYAIIQQAIEQVRISNIVDKKLYELSDGQLQMVMIARALAQDTPIIMLDEPTAHLDLNNRLEIMSLLRKLAHTMNKAILVATHELDLALQTADLIWLAGRNKNILKGIPEDLVLNGTFDEIFQFKGFDLKTGKVHHEIHRKETIRLIGTNHEHLWTRNALERSGFEITDERPTFTIAIVKESGRNRWLVDDTLSFNSIHDLLFHLNGHTDTHRA